MADIVGVKFHMHGSIEKKRDTGKNWKDCMRMRMLIRNLASIVKKTWE